jgi:LPXTG-motif cell wall-anchored protein
MNQSQQFDQGLPSMRQQQQMQSPGINTNTILLIGGAALAAFLIFRKKK